MLHPLSITQPSYRPNISTPPCHLRFSLVFLLLNKTLPFIHCSSHSSLLCFTLSPLPIHQCSYHCFTVSKYAYFPIIKKVKSSTECEICGISELVSNFSVHKTVGEKFPDDLLLSPRRVVNGNEMPHTVATTQQF